MTTDETERLVLAVLSEYEGTVRDHVRKIEVRSPAQADAYWNTVWQFRIQILSDFEFLRLALRQAKYAKDRG